MNKIQFHEGGMPVNLDDLQLLQDNTFGLFKLMIDFVSGGTPAFLIQLPDISARGKEDGGEAVTVGKGCLVVKGEVIQWAETLIDERTSGLPIYACIYEQNDDRREFADGQSHDCRAVRAATISLSKDGVAEAYDITALPLLSDLLADVIAHGGWKYGTFRGVNGYNGFIRYRRLNGKMRVQIEAKSTNEEWSREDEDMYGDYRAIFNTNNVIFGRLSYKDYPLEQNGAKTGNFKYERHGVATFKPARDGMTPADCVIKMDIEV